MAQVGAPLVEVLRLPGFSLDDLPADEPEHEVAEGHQRRLGKDLASIMPGAEGSTTPKRRRGGVASVIPIGPPEAGAPARPDPDHPSQAGSALPVVPSLVAVPDDLPPLTSRAAALVERLHGDLIVALLDGLAAAGTPDLVCYVHQPDRGIPRLHLGRPDLAGLAPDRWFQVCKALDALGRSRPGVVEPFVAGGFDGIAVVVAGVGARGLWVSARDGASLGAEDVEAAVGYARGTGAAATLVDTHRAAVGAVPVVEVQVHDGQVEADVRLDGANGRAGAPTGVEAAARATITAIGSDAEFLYAAAARESGAAASLVLVRRGGRVSVGSAAGEGEGPALTAAAAVRAVQQRAA